MFKLCFRAIPLESWDFPIVLASGCGSSAVAVCFIPGAAQMGPSPAPGAHSPRWGLCPCPGSRTSSALCARPTGFRGCRADSSALLAPRRELYQNPFLHRKGSAQLMLMVGVLMKAGLECWQLSVCLLCLPGAARPRGLQPAAAGLEELRSCPCPLAWCLCSGAAARGSAGAGATGPESVGSSFGPTEGAEGVGVLLGSQHPQHHQHQQLQLQQLQHQHQLQQHQHQPGLLARPRLLSCSAGPRGLHRAGPVGACSCRVGSLALVAQRLSEL